MQVHHALQRRPLGTISRLPAEWSPEKRKAIVDAIPLKRLGKPEDVAEAALFLASDSAAFITGEIIDVNGGFLMD
jgi:3-oxoacyl-[acyl-carrier protein] reductase